MSVQRVDVTNETVGCGVFASTYFPSLIFVWSLHVIAAPAWVFSRYSHSTKDKKKSQVNHYSVGVSVNGCLFRYVRKKQIQLSQACNESWDMVMDMVFQVLWKHLSQKCSNSQITPKLLKQWSCSYIYTDLILSSSNCTFTSTSTQISVKLSFWVRPA